MLSKVLCHAFILRHIKVFQNIVSLEKWHEYNYPNFYFRGKTNTMKGLLFFYDRDKMKVNIIHLCKKK